MHLVGVQIAHLCSRGLGGFREDVAHGRLAKEVEGQGDLVLQLLIHCVVRYQAIQERVLRVSFVDTVQAAEKATKGRRSTATSVSWRKSCTI